MRRIPCWFAVLVITLAAARGAAAQDNPPPYRPLPIPVPAKATVHAELDLHDDDLLGVAKSLLKGVNGTTVSAAIGLLNPTGGGPVPAIAVQVAQVVGGALGIAGFPAPEANLADIFKEVHQLRLVLLSPPADLSADALVAFYEKPFAAEGGRRVAWAQAGDTRLLIVGFPSRGGFAALLVAGRGKPALVARADGYPSLESVAPIIAGALPAVRAAGRPAPGPRAVPTRTAPSLVGSPAGKR